MKRSVILLAIIFIAIAPILAQYNDTSIGARIGQGDGYSVEISYQVPLCPRCDKRLEITGGMVGGDCWSSVTAYGVNTIFQVVDHLEQGWQWYYGPGIFLGGSTYYGTDVIGNITRKGTNFINIGFIPSIGLEKHFKKSPLNISFDCRPNIPLVNVNFANWGSIGFTFRYRFAKKY